MSLENKFPKTIFSNQHIKKYGLKKAITKQLSVISGELFEIQDAFSNNNYDNAIEESIDAIQSIFTLLYMIPGYSEKKIYDNINKVKEKNNKRNYYERQKNDY